jgi:hypothetical protein
MDKVDKMDCRANGEVIFCAMSPPLSQGPHISDQSEHRIDREKKWVLSHHSRPRTTNCLDRDIRKMNNGKQWITN